MKDIKLHNLLSSFIAEAFPFIQPALEKKWLKSTYEYPELTFNSNGMPNIRKHSYNTPYKITDLFTGWGGKADLEIKELLSYKELFSYLLTHEKHIEGCFEINI